MRIVLAMIWCVALAGCSAAASPSRTQELSPAAASSPSPTGGAGGLSATTEPAESPPPGAITIELSSFMFAPSVLDASAGTAVFFLKNVGAGADHDLAIGPDQGHVLALSDHVAAGTAAIFTVEHLAPGTYAIWCTRPGHAAAGMVGTLTVNP